MARLVRLALPTNATWSSTTMTLACSEAPGGRAEAGQYRRSAFSAGKGVATDV